MNENLYPIYTPNAMSDRDESYRIIAAGPLSKQPGTIYYRIILVEYENGSFSVHSQGFNEKADLKANVKGSWQSGNYFRKDEIAQATKKFAERVSSQASFLNSTLDYDGK